MQQNVNLQAILDKGKAFLDRGDVAGYWKHMSQVTDYARLAGDVASGDGLFAHQLTSPIGGLRSNRVTLKIGLLFFAIEDIIRGDMHQRGAAECRG